MIRVRDTLFPSNARVVTNLMIGRHDRLKTDQNMNCSFRSEESPCGLRGVGTVILPLLACKRDMTFHLLSLKISVKRGRGSTEVSETEF